MSQEILQKTFKVDSPVRLTLSNIRGTVNIYPGEDNAVHITAVKQLDSGNPEHTKIEIEQLDENSISIKTKYRENGRLSLLSRKPSKVEYTLQVPKTCILNVSGVSNSTNIQGIDSEICLNTVSGPIILDDCSGSLNLNSVSGDISGNIFKGSLEFDTVSGKIYLNDSHVSRIDGETVSGAISIETPLLEGPYHFKSVSGNVEMLLPSDTACTVRTKSISGRIKTPLTTSMRHSHGGNHHFEMNGGGIEVRLYSVSGNLVITPSEDINNILEKKIEHPSDQDQIPNTESSNPPTNEDTMAILEQIANGDISVEEALEKIG
jgi:DUF4097 and DUF4098 domain-containing protein YvlB